MKLLTQLSLFFLITIYGTAQETGYPVKEYLSQINISDISASPNGNHIAVITTQDNFEQNRTDKKLWVFKIDKEGEVISKSEVPIYKNTVSSPQWTRDSQFLIFKSKDSIEKGVFKIAMTNPKRIVSVATQPNLLKRLQSYKVCKNNSILYTETTSIPKQKLDSMVITLPSILPTMHTTIKRFHMETQKIDSLYNIPKNVSYFDLSPDESKMIYSTSDPSNYYEPDYYKNSHTYIINSNSGTLIKQWTKDMFWDRSNWLSNDEIFTYFSGDPSIKKQNVHKTFFVSDLAQNNKKQLLKNFTGNVNSYTQWKSNQLLINAYVSTKYNFFLTDFANDNTVQLTDFHGSIHNVTTSTSENLIAFSMITNKKFEEVYISRTIEGLKQPIKISNFNANLNTYPSPEVETISWKNSKGDAIDGVLLWPPNKKDESGLPLAVDIHGGPWSSRSEAIVLSGMHFYYFYSLLASKGFVVFLPNYSGSNGKGRKFSDEIIGAPRTQPTDDILTGVEYIIKNKKVNKEQMIVKGASYGGLLTNSIIGETDIFKAALTSCGTWNEISEFGTNDGNIGSDILFDGIRIWEQPELYRKESSIYNAQKIKTPTLITHGEKDIRVPTHNSYAMYYTLKDLGVPVQLLIYKNEGHVYRQPLNKLAKVMAELEFITRYIKL